MYIYIYIYINKRIVAVFILGTMLCSSLTTNYSTTFTWPLQDTSITSIGWCLA